MFKRFDATLENTTRLGRATPFLLTAVLSRIQRKSPRSIPSPIQPFAVAPAAAEAVAVHLLLVLLHHPLHHARPIVRANWCQATPLYPFSLGRKGTLMARDGRSPLLQRHRPRHRRLHPLSLAADRSRPNRPSPIAVSARLADDKRKSPSLNPGVTDPTVHPHENAC